MDGLNDWLLGFKLDDHLHPHVVAVFRQLPESIRLALMSDGSFRLLDYEPTRGQTVTIPFASPGLGKPARSVVLKRTLRQRSPEFVRYIIAHELAHAHLNNGGRFPGEDPEHAADALAADWGFPKPASSSV